MATVFIIIFSLKCHILKGQVSKIPKMYSFLGVETAIMTLCRQYQQVTRTRKNARKLYIF